MKLLCTDRAGVLAALATLMAAENFNIVALDVERQSGQAAVYLEVEGREITDSAPLLDKVRALPDLLDASLVQTLPHEKREKRMQILLDSVSDGILFIDEDGFLVMLNRVAQQMLALGETGSIGKHVSSLNLPDHSILESLQNRSFSNIKRDIVTPAGRRQLFVSSQPICNSSGKIIGAVQVLKDFREIRSLARSVMRPPQITFSDIIGESVAIKNAISLARKVARSDSCVMLRGESGTGKELFAAAIHAESGRKGGFVAINCATLPEALLESELFGYTGGAFSGARKEGKAGLFEAAEGGTLFLDEIGELQLPLQSKLLRAIQEKKIRRVGDNRETGVDVSLIAATNRPLEQLVKERQFREDLYYRINVLPIHIPPLRERRQDIPALAEHFTLQLSAGLDRKLTGITRDAMEKLCRYKWPGNVRELRNVIERSAVFCGSELIDAESIIFGFDQERAMAGIMSQLGSLPHQATLRERLASFEEQIVREALSGSRSIRQAANRLGISHTALLKKLRKTASHHLETFDSTGN
jgi:transcriptional regulator of aroF, aroG, tyrA and aromatic amino acid transport